jgi:hypothetical protein
MPTPHRLLSTTTKKSAVPTNVFDPWNSSSTGHQRADHPTYSQTTGWRQTRTEKLARQFGGNGPPRGRNAKGMASGGLQSGEWRWLSAEETKRKELGCEDIRKYMGGQRKKRKIEEIMEMGNNEKCNKRLSSLSSIRPDNDGHRKEMNEEKEKPSITTTTATTDQPTTPHRDNKDKYKDKTTSNSNGIFSGLSIYINGSTAPLISDHRLKQLLVENGANISIALGRRTVTHVILGKPNVNNSSSGRSKNDDGDDAMNINKYRGIGGGGAGAGGGLAAGKLQREIQRIGGKGVIYVDVEW